MNYRVVLFLFFGSFLQPVFGIANWFEAVADTSVELFMTTDEIIVKDGYPCEKHEVETEDGYVVTVFRIVNRGRTPVYFFHGVMEDSSSAILSGPGKALGYLLHDAGYDVWLANARGTRYSLKHREFLIEDPRFWDFSFHELGVYDVPNTIDYILAKTGRRRLQYVGYSQGTTAFWIMCSERPKYRRKIIMMSAMAPVAAISHTRSVALRILAPIERSTFFTQNLLGVTEFLPNTILVRTMAALACNDQAVTQAICSSMLFLIGGVDTVLLNETNLPVMMSHTPSGCATKQILHHLQSVNSGLFRQYDYGIWKNLRRYRRIQPPAYHLSKVNMPVALHYGPNDVITLPVDVNALAKRMPNVRKRLVPFKLFTHIDFMHGINASVLVYDTLIREMKLVG